MSKHTFYVVVGDRGFIELRQKRYRALYESGSEHQHDLCALATNVEQLRQMTASFQGGIDWSAVTSGYENACVVLCPNCAPSSAPALPGLWRPIAFDDRRMAGQECSTCGKELRIKIEVL